MARAGAASARSLSACALAAALALASSTRVAGAAPQVAASQDATRAATSSKASAIDDSVLSDPIAREWLVRDLAADPRAHAERLGELIGSGSPQRARLAFDVVRRGLVSSPSRELARLACQLCLLRPPDERADVQLARLEALSATRIGVKSTNCFALEPATLVDSLPGYAHEHRAPWLRAASARALRFEARDEWARPALVALLADGDEEVRREAFAALGLRLLEGSTSVDAAGALWGAIAGLEDPIEQVEAFRLLEALRLPPGALDEMARAAGEASAPLRAALEALRSCAGASPDGQVLIDGWLALEGPSVGLRELLALGARYERARTNSASSEPMRSMLIERLAAESDPATHDVLLSLALEAVDMRDLALVVESSPRFDDSLRTLLFERLRGYSVDWTRQMLAPWLNPGLRTKELRLTVVDWLGATAVGAQARELEWALALALTDPDLDIARLAFAGLCDVADPWIWSSALRRAWLRFDDSEKLALAARLPRARAWTDLRDEFVRLSESDAQARQELLELLAAFAPDAELAQRAQAWLAAELASWSDAAPDGAQETRIAGLARALGRLAPDAAVEELDALAQWSAGRSDEVGKIALFALGQTPDGRAKLPRWISANAPSRLRIEAALMLAPHGDSAAEASLRSDFARSDLALQGRIVDALAAYDSPAAQEFLRELAFDERAELQVRLRALERVASGSPERTRVLEAATWDPHHEVALAAWRLYGREGGSVARVALTERLLELGRRLRGAPAADRALHESERNELLRVAAEIELVDAALFEEWRTRFDAQDAEDLRERFTDESEPRPDFAYGPELAFARALASRRRLAEALALDARWRRWDAAVLERMGALACDVGELATGRELLAAAHVALLGEPDGDLRRKRRFLLRQRQLAAAESAGDWKQFAHFAAEQLDAARTRRVGARTLESALGPRDPLARRDGVVGLECGSFLVRARLAFESGQIEDAHQWYARGSAVVQASASVMAVFRRYVGDWSRQLRETK